MTIKRLSGLTFFSLIIIAFALIVIDSGMPCENAVHTETRITHYPKVDVIKELYMGTRENAFVDSECGYWEVSNIRK
jgi:hypothetical protein